mgnify:FL=1
MRIKKGMFFIVILIGSLIGSANMKEVKAEDSDSIEAVSYTHLRAHET